MSRQGNVMLVVRDPSTFHSRQPLHMAIGMFDGVHLGHRAVIESCIHAAHSRGGQSAVMTFTPHPSRILHPSQPTLLIQSEEQKQERIAALGVDVLVWQTFTTDLAAIPAEAYLSRLKARFPTLASIHVGENFRFGHGRTGDIATLLSSAVAQKIHVLSIERVRYDGEPISSTRIRTILSEGRMEDANELLGYNYYCAGKVVPGNKLGRTIGFPTLNIPWEPQSLPRFGSYAATVRREGEPSEKALPAVANFGLRPTIEGTGKKPLLEANILGPCPFTEGDTLRVEWLRFLRPERRFTGMAELKAQIALDSELARKWLATDRA
jgi:riboflavin kinase / FMN adenylyltransferase